MIFRLSVDQAVESADEFNDMRWLEKLASIEGCDSVGSLWPLLLS